MNPGGLILDFGEPMNDDKLADDILRYLDRIYDEETHLFACRASDRRESGEAVDECETHGFAAAGYRPKAEADNRVAAEGEKGFF